MKKDKQEEKENSQRNLLEVIKKLHKNNKGKTLILLSALAFGSYGIWSKLIGEGNFGNFYQGYSRAIIIALILTPILLYKKEFVKIEKKDWKNLFIFLLFTSFSQAPIYYAFNHMDIGTATLLFFVSMILTMYFIGFVFLKEKITKIKLISLFLALIGMIITFKTSISTFAILAGVMAVLNGVMSGGEISFSKTLEKYSTLYITFLSWAVIILTNFIFSIFLNEIQSVPEFNIYWLYNLAYAVVSIFGFYLVIEGLKTTDASIGGLIGLLEIFFSFLLAYLVFGEKISVDVLVGGLIIILAASLPDVYKLLKIKKM